MGDPKFLVNGPSTCNAKFSENIHTKHTIIGITKCEGQVRSVPDRLVKGRSDIAESFLHEKEGSVQYVHLFTC